jgi:hypothetical protein
MKQSQFYYLLRRGLFGGGGIWAKYVNDFKARVIADGGTMESPSCAKTDVKFLVQNPEPVAFTGLLNDYSGAAAAYSLRLLDNTYTGDAIVVRRASDNTTQAIGFVNNELDTTSLESFCSGTDGFVTTWYDQSGNGFDATQTTAGSQPQIVSSGTSLGYIENKTDAGNQYLVSSYAYDSTKPFSSFVTAQDFGNGSLPIYGAILGSTGTTSTNPYYALSMSGSTANAQGGFSNISYFADGSSIGTTRNDIYNAVSTFGLLSTLATIDTSTPNIKFGYHTNAFNGLRIKEFIVYDNQTISRTGVENNIITHYGF